MLLASAGVMEFGLQFLIPIVLVRNLSTSDFGLYRLLTLTASTALALAPAFMPQSLYYLLPPASKPDRLKIIGNVIIYLIVSGACVALTTSPINPFVNGSISVLFKDTYGASSLYLWMFVVASLSAVLPIAQGHVLWQVKVDVPLFVFRTVMIAISSMLSHQVRWVIFALLLEMTLRILALLLYVFSRSGIKSIECNIPSLLRQLRFSLPFAIGGALFVMRAQCDQWLAASILSAGSFAAFTIGAVVLPIATLVRQPINNAVLPALSKALASNNIVRVCELLSKGSRITVLTLIPVSGALFLIAPELVNVVYTQKYHAAVPAMQGYLIGIGLQAIATGYALPALGLGRFALINNAICLILSVILSWAGATYFGIAGACFGSVISFFVSEMWNLYILSKKLGKGISSILPLSSLFRTSLSVLVALAISTIAASYFSFSEIGFIIIKVLFYGAILSIILLPFGGWREIKYLRAQA